MNIKRFFGSIVQAVQSATRKCVTAIQRFRSELGAKLKTPHPFAGQGIRWIGQHREALCYYSVLALVLAALGTAAYGYRNGENQMITHQELPQTAAAVQVMPGITSTPEPDSIGLLFPVSGAILQHYVADELIWSDSLGMWQTHPAVDFSADAGEAVVAAESAAVRDVYCDSLYGNTIVLDLGDGRTMRYASLNTLQLVQIGQKVERGEVISSAGTCDGEAERDVHIHVEYYENGVPVDPTALFVEN